MYTFVNFYRIYRYLDLIGKKPFIYFALLFIFQSLGLVLGLVLGAP